MADKDSRLHVTSLNCLEIVFLSLKGQCLAKVGDGAADLWVALGQHARLRAHGDDRCVRAHTCPPSSHDSPPREREPPSQHPSGRGHHLPSVERQGAQQCAASPL